MGGCFMAPRQLLRQRCDLRPSRFRRMIPRSDVPDLALERLLAYGRGGKPRARQPPRARSRDAGNSQTRTALLLRDEALYSLPLPGGGMRVVGSCFQRNLVQGSRRATCFPFAAGTRLGRRERDKPAAGGSGERSRNTHRLLNVSLGHKGNRSQAAQMPRLPSSDPGAGSPRPYETFAKPLQFSNIIADKDGYACRE